MERNPARLWDFPCAAFLIFILLTTGQRLYATHWAKGLGAAVVLSIIGALLGLALGYSKFKQRLVFWFTFGFSLPIVPLVLGRSLYHQVSWLECFADLSRRLAYSLDLFLLKQPVQDTALFIVFMALIFWAVGLMAGYATTRYGNILGAVLPSGVVFVTIQLYDPGRAGSDELLALFFILCLFLLGRLAYIRNRKAWKEQHVSLLAEARADMNIILVMATLAAVLLVWITPTSAESFANMKTAWEKFIQPLQEVQKDLGHAVAGLQAPAKISTIQFYGDTLTLGNQASSGDAIYFQVQTPLVSSTTRYYWRVRSYNIYSNGHWSAGGISTTSFDSTHGLIPLADPEGVTSKFTIMLGSMNLSDLVTPARPVWVSLPASLSYVQVPPGKMDPVQFRPSSPILAGENYDVRANEYEPTIAQLRSAGENYPAWVSANYLQKPGGLPLEITALANRITAGKKTPYDKADAITNYLRSNITYSQTAEAPPAGFDALTWFLFDSKSGFCNYYATAEVVLLREVGIPSRLAVGFAQGEFESPNFYVVRQRNAHAWPEVYFPDVGWVEFEPTGNQAPLERPQGQAPSTIKTAGTPVPAGAAPATPAPSQPAAANATHGAPSALTLTFLRLLIRLGLLWFGLGLILKWVSLGTFDRLLGTNQPGASRSLTARWRALMEKWALAMPGWLRRWAAQAELNPLERSFRMVYRSLSRLGLKASPDQTPAEAAGLLTGQLPEAAQEINALLQEYQRHLYSQKHGYYPLARKAVRTIRQATFRALIRRRWRAFRGILRLGRKPKESKPENGS